MNSSLFGGLFGLLAIMVGLGARRFPAAFKWGAVIGSIWAAALVASVIFGPAVTAGANYARFSGYIIGTIVGCGVLGLFGHTLRRGFGALGRLFGKSSSQKPLEP